VRGCRISTGSFSHAMKTERLPRASTGGRDTKGVSAFRVQEPQREPSTVMTAGDEAVNDVQPGIMAKIATTTGSQQAVPISLVRTHELWVWRSENARRSAR
jgi:hypothetical protein